MAGNSMAQLRQRAGSFDWGRCEEIGDFGGEVAIAGVGESAYSGPSGRSAKAMALEAIAQAIADAGLEPADIDGLMSTPRVADQVTPADFHSHFGTTQELWYSGEGGAMVWAATCTAHAAEALRSRKARHIVNVFAVDWASRRAAGVGTPGDWHAGESMKALFELPFGWYPQPVYMATQACRHMHEYGTTAEQLGELAVAFRRHANGHPGAVMRGKTLSMEQYLSRPMLADPLRVEDCCLISDGAAASVMTSVERARDLRHRPVVVEGVGHGIIANAPYISQQRKLAATPQTFAAPWAFAMADMQPGEVDVLALYDCFSITALMMIEDMGFCAKGEAGAFVSGGTLHYDRPRSSGGLPCNTHGGLMSHAYVLGIAHIVELVRQLRGEAANQVVDARVGVYGGFTADEAATLILRRA
jgi:acetyl-CoA acetyltransferase